MEIWDAHVHLGKPHVDEIWLKEKAAFEVVDDMKLIRDMESYAISKSLIFPTQSVGMDYVESNTAIAEWTKKHPEKFIGFARVDPRLGDRSLNEVRRAAEIGLKGLKLHPEIESFRPDHSAYEPLYKTLIDVGFVLTIHAEAKEKNSSPYFVEKVAKKFPDLKIILDHLSADALTVIERTKNLWADTALTSFKTIKMAFGLGLGDKICFGSDYPYGNGPEFEIWKVKKALPNEKDQSKVFHENLQNLLR